MESIKVFRILEIETGQIAKGTLDTIIEWIEEMHQEFPDKSLCFKEIANKEEITNISEEE